MADRCSNEYLRSPRAQNDDNDLFSAIGKQVLGLKLDDEGDLPEDDRVKIVDEIESLCMNCHENGTTRLLLTKIPYFREVVLMSFYCDHCFFQNNEIQPASEVQEQGVKHVFQITHVDDLQRQVIKSETATLKIEDLDIEIPTGHGRLTNVEGIITEVLTNLEVGQKQRRKEDPETYQKIDDIVQALVKMSNGARLPFTISLDDPAGNSSIEPSTDDTANANKYVRKQYPRTPAQNITIGLAQGEHQEDGTKGIVPQIGEDSGEGMEDVDIMEGKSYDLPVECPGCTKPAHMLLQMVNIPHFKQVVLSTTQCDNCIYHTTDVKTGGEIPEKGKRIYLHVKRPEDLRRDILKSETCLLKIPECKVEVVPGTMGGRFTTVEGLITQIRDDLRVNIFGDDEENMASDSMPNEKKEAWLEFFSQMDKAVRGDLQYTVIMEDPLGSSYCQEFGEPGQDANVESEEYERTAEEEDHLGLADMKTHRNGNGEYVKEPSNCTWNLK